MRNPDDSMIIRAARAWAKVGVVRNSWISLVLLFVVAISATAQAQDRSIPKREAFTLPAQMKAFGKGLEEAGVKCMLPALVTHAQPKANRHIL